jgi:hypothetical protein
LTKRGVHVHASSNPVKIEKMASGKLSLTLEQGASILECDIVMFATGRSPNTNRPDLGLVSGPYPQTRTLNRTQTQTRALNRTQTQTRTRIQRRPILKPAV